MGARVLVSYASQFGATQAIAETIGAALREAGAEVDVRLVLDVNDLSGYQAVIVGSPIYNGQWLPEAIYFVQHYEATLRQMPVAYFVVSMTMREDTPEHRQRVLEYLAMVREAAPTIEPVDIGLFAGKLDYHNLPLLDRVLFWLRERLPSGDFRNWNVVRTWVERVRPELTKN